MATLTRSTGTVTLSGAAEKVNMSAAYGWIWVKNMSDGDVFVGLSADISEGADGVMTIPAGECGRLYADGSREFYLMGTGNALIVAQNYADCPFKAAKKGGGSNIGIYPLDPQTGLPYGDVTVGNGIITLTGTFKDNTAVTSAKLPDSLKTIGNYAFYNCANLKTVDFAKVEEIGENVFRNSGITAAVFPETLNKIGLYAFTSCTALTSVYIPASCTSIGWNAFAQDTALLDLRVGVGFNADLTITYVGNNQITAETINAIIANYAENSGKTLTMGSTYLAKLTDEDKAAAAAKGLTLA